MTDVNQHSEHQSVSEIKNTGKSISWKSLRIDVPNYALALRSYNLERFEISAAVLCFSTPASFGAPVALAIGSR
jgi:hypothetical protein